MGLDTTHECWHGSYSSFGRWRAKVCEVAGYGEIRARVGFGGGIEWPANDPLVVLLSHSDCDGEISTEDCLGIADRLEELMPALRDAGGDYAEDAQQWINGLRDAVAGGESVEFH